MWFFRRTRKSNDQDNLANIVTGCSVSDHTEYLSHDVDTWVSLQEAHERVKSRYAKDWHSSGKSRAGTNKEDDNIIPHSGMMVPFGVKTNTDTGLRQVYAAEDVAKGQRLWKPLHYHTFQSEYGYVEFLMELPHHLQCDVLEWTHPSYYNTYHQEEETETTWVDITLDEGTFIQETTNPEEANIDYDCVAVRNIKAGEFVFMNHTDVILPPTSSSSSRHSESGIEWFDIIRSTAWKRTGLGMGGKTTELEHQQRHQQRQHSTIAPGMAILSALYVVARIFRGRKSSSVSSSQGNHNNRDYGCDYDCDYGYNDNDYYGVSFYRLKSKLA